MLKNIFLITCIFISLWTLGQQKPSGGEFSLGMRSSISLFGNEGNTGLGAGAQMQLRFFQWMNSEWFLDYITTNISDLGYRRDAHIGWSVIFEPKHYEIKENQILTPFIIAGHCFDYTEVHSFTEQGGQAKRWSSAVQAGLGLNYRLNNRFNFGLNCHYMLHLGKHLDAHIHGSGANQHLEVELSDSNELEGHLFLVLSLNVIIADLWKSKK
jgi:hypothetical protein